MTQLTDENLLLARRFVAVLHAVFALVHLATGLLFAGAFGGMGALVFALGSMDGDRGALIGGGLFGGMGAFVGLLVVVLFGPSLLAAIGLWHRGGIWRDVVALVAVVAVQSQVTVGWALGLITIAVVLGDRFRHHLRAPAAA